MDTDARRARAAGAVAIGLALITTVVGSYSIHTAIPHNPIHLPYERTIQMSSLLPQGWKFFTRDPQSEDLTVLRYGAGGWSVPENVTNGSSRNLFGASRQGRAVMVEAGRVIGGVAEWRWEDCKEAPAACLERATPVDVREAQPGAQLCGDIGVVKRKPVPWAWARSQEGIEMPGKVLRLRVQC